MGTRFNEGKRLSFLMSSNLQLLGFVDAPGSRNGVVRCGDSERKSIWAWDRLTRVGRRSKAGEGLADKPIAAEEGRTAQNKDPAHDLRKFYIDVVINAK